MKFLICLPGLFFFLFHPSAQNQIKGSTVQDEFFTDSLHIGKAKQHKVTLHKFIKNDTVFVQIDFFQKNTKKWQLQNQFLFEKDEVLSCNPEITDFNGDGYNDFIFTSGMAARGANEIRKLIVYDVKKDKWLFIKNSEEFPNLMYNSENKKLQATAFYGNTVATYHLKIVTDSLVMLKEEKEEM